MLLLLLLLLWRRRGRSMKRRRPAQAGEPPPPPPGSQTKQQATLARWFSGKAAAGASDGVIDVEEACADVEFAVAAAAPAAAPPAAWGAIVRVGVGPLVCCAGTACFAGRHYDSVFQDVRHPSVGTAAGLDGIRCSGWGRPPRTRSLR